MCLIYFGRESLYNCIYCTTILELYIFKRHCLGYFPSDIMFKSLVRCSKCIVFDWLVIFSLSTKNMETKVHVFVGEVAAFARFLGNKSRGRGGGRGQQG